MKLYKYTVTVFAQDRADSLILDMLGGGDVFADGDSMTEECCEEQDLPEGVCVRGCGFAAK